jgi:hypothetical protein
LFNILVSVIELRTQYLVNKLKLLHDYIGSIRYMRGNSEHNTILQ